MYVLIENQQITRLYDVLPDVYSEGQFNYENFKVAPEELLQQLGFVMVVTPNYNAATHTLGNVVYNAQTNTATYEVLALTQAQLLNWKHVDRPIRLTVPVALLFSAPSWLALWNYCQAMEIPSYLQNGCRVFYLETILPDHEAGVDAQHNAFLAGLTPFDIIKETLTSTP